MLKRILVFILTGLLVTALSTGAAWAKPDNPGKTKAKEKISAMQMYKAKYKEAVKAGAVHKSYKFKDIHNHWASGSIQRMAMLGLFAGYDDGRFKPNDNISQAEMIALLMRLVDYNTGDGEDVDEDKINKVPAWAREAVRNAVRLKIMSLNRFHSAEQASRAQVCIALGKILEREGYLDLKKLKLAPGDLPFVDGALLVDNDGLVYILAMYRAGYIKGAPGNKFLPHNAITRAEMAAILERILADLEKKDDGEDKDDLSDLASELLDKYEAIGDVTVDDIRLDGNEDEVDVRVEVDLDDYEDEWGLLNDSDIKDWLENLVGAIQDELSKYTEVSGVIINSDNDDVLVKFNKNGTGSMVVKYYDKDYRVIDEDVEDVENELKGDRFNVHDIEFRVTSINYDQDDDEILAYLKATRYSATNKWNALDSDDIEDEVADICVEITRAFQENAGVEPKMTYISFYDQNSRLLGSYVYDVDDESLD